MEGWIKLHRKMINWEWYQDKNVKELFIHLLLTVNHKDKKWQGIEVKRGQRITSLEHLSNEINLSIMQIRTALNKLKLTNEITVKTTNKYTVITIVKYDDYQCQDNLDNNQDNIQNNNQITDKQQTNNKQITTNKNVKNIKNDKNVTTTIIDDSCVDGLQEVIDFYSNNIGFLNPYGLKILESYVEDMSSELVIYAMQIAVENNKKTISYIKAILNNWTKANIKTLEEAKRENKKKVSSNKQIEQRKYTEDEFESLYVNGG